MLARSITNGVTASLLLLSAATLSAQPTGLTQAFGGTVYTFSGVNGTAVGNSLLGTAGVSFSQFACYNTELSDPTVLGGAPVKISNLTSFDSSCNGGSVYPQFPSITLTFDRVLTSFGIDGYVDGTGATNLFTFTVNGQSVDVARDVLMNEFAGVTDANGFTSVTISATNFGDFAFDDFETETTPEPASLVLIGTGLLGIAGIARRRRMKA